MPTAVIYRSITTPIENAIRPIAIGKKNWLFAGSERAGKRAAAIQTLFGTAKLTGIEPCAWLKDVLEKFAAVQMLDVHLPTTDGRELVLTRHTEPDGKRHLSTILNCASQSVRMVST